MVKFYIQWLILFYNTRFIYSLSSQQLYFECLFFILTTYDNNSEFHHEWSVDAMYIFAISRNLPLMVAIVTVNNEK